MDINDILSVVHELGGEGFSDMAEKEIKELIDGHEEELREEDEEQLVKNEE
jgi:predicted RNase H-like HicB family nuclease